MGDVSRRAFLSRSGAVAGSLALGGVAACESGAERADRQRGTDGAASGAAFDPGDWESVRDQFPLTPDIGHFAAFVLAAHPRPVADAIERHRRGLDEDTHGYLEEHEGENELAARAAAAEYLGADADEIAFTDSTTMGLGLVYGGLRLRPGQEVVTTEHDFYSTHEALRLAADRAGATVRRVRLYDRPAQASVDEIVGRLAAAVTPATRAVAVTWVHSSTGVKLPIAQIGAALAELNAARDAAERVLLCVDGVHGLGAEDETVETLGCAFLMSGTHKWLFGPRGTGIVWGRRDAWDAIGPTIPPFAGEHFGAWAAGVAPPGTDPGASNTPGGYHSFEHRWAVAEAFRFHLDIGRAAVAERTREQATQLKAGLAESGIEVVTPADPGLSAGIVCVSMGEIAPEGVVGSLLDRGIATSVTPYREQYLRFGPSIVTSPDEVKAVVDAMRDLS
ncbi:MAG TPA: aminotransferase class V-fold PLP-dependent enzyme [Acidimicrobiales bacterium]|nr:aminotransferase class V-fold PLP-dependent enzyme [Acidimicrobiales bacterium]